MENFYSYDMSAPSSLVKSHQLQLPFLSASESLLRDDVVPHLGILIARP